VAGRRQGDLQIAELEVLPGVELDDATETAALDDIADAVRGYKRRARQQAALARELQQLRESARMLAEANPDKHRAREALGELAVLREELGLLGDEAISMGATYELTAMAGGITYHSFLNYMKQGEQETSGPFFNFFHDIQKM
jgi:hypothetical protein